MSFNLGRTTAGEQDGEGDEGLYAEDERGAAADEQAGTEERVGQDQTDAATEQAFAQTAQPPDRLLSDEPAAPAPSMAQDPNVRGYTAPEGVPDAGATSSKLAQAVAAKLMELRGAAGVPQPQSFNDTLDIQTALARRKNARGDLSPKDYAQQQAFLKLTRDEGVHDALSAFASGDYEGGIAIFNGVGNNTGARLIKGEQGSTDIDGRAYPTHFVTLANPDGTRSTIDVTKAQNQLRELGSQLADAGRVGRNSADLLDVDAANAKAATVPDPVDSPSAPVAASTIRTPGGVVPPSAQPQAPKVAAPVDGSDVRADHRSLSDKASATDQDMLASSDEKNSTPDEKIVPPNSNGEVREKSDGALKKYSAYDLSTEAGMRKFIDNISQRRKVKDSISPDELQTAKTILSSYYGIDGSVGKAFKEWNALPADKVSEKFEEITTRIDLWKKLNDHFETNVNFAALTQFEGGQKLNGYIPKKKDGAIIGQSGTTIATAFDIGQMRKSEIKKLGLDSSLVEKLLPYAYPMKKKEADEFLTKNKLIISRQEAMDIDKTIYKKHLLSAINSWNRSKPANTPSFEKLSSAQQTVIFSRTYHQGVGFPTTHEARAFYPAAQANRWDEAESALRNYPVTTPDYKNRVAKEANLLELERSQNGR